MSAIVSYSFSINEKYINFDVYFDAKNSYETYIYQIMVSIAVALRWGISFILFGLAANLLVGTIGSWTIDGNIKGNED